MQRFKVILASFIFVFTILLAFNIANKALILSASALLILLKEVVQSRYESDLNDEVDIEKNEESISTKNKIFTDLMTVIVCFALVLPPIFVQRSFKLIAQQDRESYTLLLERNGQLYAYSSDSGKERLIYRSPSKILKKVWSLDGKYVGLIIDDVKSDQKVSESKPNNYEKGFYILEVDTGKFRGGSIYNLNQTARFNPRGNLDDVVAVKDGFVIKTDLKEFYFIGFDNRGQEINVDYSLIDKRYENYENESKIDVNLLGGESNGFYIGLTDENETSAGGPMHIGWVPLVGGAQLVTKASSSENVLVRGFKSNGKGSFAFISGFKVDGCQIDIGGARVFKKGRPGLLFSELPDPSEGTFRDFISMQTSSDIDEVYMSIVFNSRDCVSDPNPYVSIYKSSHGKDFEIVQVPEGTLVLIPLSNGKNLYVKGKLIIERGFHSDPCFDYKCSLEDEDGDLSVSGLTDVPLIYRGSR